MVHVQLHSKETDHKDLGFSLDLTWGKVICDHGLHLTMFNQPA
jgi:hypothetical protein